MVLLGYHEITCHLEIMTQNEAPTLPTLKSKELCGRIYRLPEIGIPEQAKL